MPSAPRHCWGTVPLVSTSSVRPKAGPRQTSPDVSVGDLLCPALRRPQPSPQHPSPQKEITGGPGGCVQTLVVPEHAPHRQTGGAGWSTPALRTPTAWTIQTFSSCFPSRFESDLQAMTGRPLNWYWKVMWAGVSPLLIVSLLVFYLSDYILTGTLRYQAWDASQVPAGSGAWAFSV